MNFKSSTVIAALLLLLPKKEKSDLQNKQAGIDIAMAEKYLDEAAAKTLDIADKKPCLTYLCAK